MFKNNAINKKDNLFKVLKIIILKFYTQQKKKVKNIIFRQTKPKKKTKKRCYQQICTIRNGKENSSGRRKKVPNDNFDLHISSEASKTVMMCVNVNDIHILKFL